MQVVNILLAFLLQSHSLLAQRGIPGGQDGPGGQVPGDGPGGQVPGDGPGGQVPGDGPVEPTLPSPSTVPTVIEIPITTTIRPVVSATRIPTRTTAVAVATSSPSSPARTVISATSITMTTTESRSTSVSPTAASESSQTSKSNTTPAIISVIVGVGALVIAGIAIFIFRKLGTNPSDSFKNRLRSSFNPAPHHSHNSESGVSSISRSTAPSNAPKYAVYEYEKPLPAANIEGLDDKFSSKQTLYNQQSPSQQQYAVYESHQDIPLHEFANQQEQHHNTAGYY